MTFIALLRARLTKWSALLAAAAVLSTLGGTPIAARAATGSLVLAALSTLERDYVDWVQPVDLLNAAIAMLRQETNESVVDLPDIPAADTEPQADAAFVAEFELAARTGGVPETELAYAATRGLLAALHDSHTYFLEPALFQESSQQIMGNAAFSGVGIRTTAQADPAGLRHLFVDDVFAGSPAERAGIHRFDQLLQVNGTALTGAAVDHVTDLVRGPAGSTAVLTVQRGMQLLQFSIVRAPIQARPVKAEWAAPGVAYVRLFEFSRGAGQDMRAALTALAAQSPVRAIVLDLRGDPGGLVGEAMQVGSLFLSPGTGLARFTDRAGRTKLLVTGGSAPFAGTPLVVLVDGGSASASEIITGAMRDAHRATIVGERTAGALGAAVEEALPEGGMSVTEERITTPRGGVVEGIGITPDLPAGLTEADMAQGVDTQLATALRSRVAAGGVTRPLPAPGPVNVP